MSQMLLLSAVATLLLLRAGIFQKDVRKKKKRENDKNEEESLKIGKWSMSMKTTLPMTSSYPQGRCISRRYYMAEQ